MGPKYNLVLILFGILCLYQHDKPEYSGSGLSFNLVSLHRCCQNYYFIYLIYYLLNFGNSMVMVNIALGDESYFLVLACPK